MRTRGDVLAGVILGTAAGDSLGLPREALSAARARRLFGGPPLTQRFLLGRGMGSDDTEHTCMAAQALLREPADPERFARVLGWKLRFWLLGLPAGLGYATLRACLKLWLGFGPSRSGVGSAGNGPAMRAAVLGVCLGDGRERLRAFVRARTRLTHTDPRAERGALLVALAAHHGATRGPDLDRAAFLAEARQAAGDDAELLGLLGQIETHLARRASVGEFVAALGLTRGVSGTCTTRCR